MSAQSFTSSDEEAGRPVKRKRTNLSRPMVKQACVICAKKKARCSGGDPCEGCKKNRLICVYNTVRRRGPKVKSRPLDDPLPSPHKDLHMSESSRSLHPRPSPHRPQPSHNFGAALNAALDASSSLAPSPFHPQVQSTPSSEANNSDSGSLVTDLILQADGPGMNYYLDIIPRDTAATQSRSPPTTLIQAPPDDGFNHWPMPTADIEASEVDLSKLADHPDVIRGLYCIYWCFVHPSWPVIYRPSYDQLNAPTKYPMLHNAVMSSCCRFDLDRQTQDMPPESRIPGLNTDNVRLIGDFFFDRAEKHRQRIEVGGGDITTVQALLIMTNREVGQNRLRSGWAYSGQAIRLALYLNLHSDGPQSSHAVFKEQEKRRVIWDCYAVDKYISLIMGKPYQLKRDHIGTPLPSTAESDEYAMWDADARLVIPGIASQFDGVRCLTVSNFKAFVKLTIIIEKILDSIPLNKSRAEQRKGSSVKELDELLVVWLKQAGDNYVEKPTMSTPPHRLLLKLWYYCCLILVHRRHMKDTTTFDRNGTAMDSHTICIDAANGICETVRVIEVNYGLYRFPSAVVFIIFQAGIIHLLNSAATDMRTSRHGAESLGQCIWWLNQIASAYGISPAHCDVLSKLKELSGREPRNQDEVAAILASRRASRNNSPAAELDSLFNGHSPVDQHHSNGMLPESLPPRNPPESDEIIGQRIDTSYNPFDISTNDFTFDTSRSMEDTTLFPDSSMLYGQLFDTVISEMPINLPSSTDDMSNWNIFQADYEALFNNQPNNRPYDNQPG